jgi:predicted nucleic acid-binding protein
MSAPSVALADANIFLRFLRNDHPSRSAAARTVMEAAREGDVTLQVPEVVVIDTFYTLTAPGMRLSRPVAARQLAALLQQPGIELRDRSRVLEILAICEGANIDYCDAALVVESRKSNLPILSYDRDFAKMSDVAALSPIDWVNRLKAK